MNKELLKDITVVELAGVLAGPAVGMFFAELGATVIKIENPAAGGDVTRHWKLAAEDPASPVSAYYASVNWHKQVRFCDLKSAEGKAEVYELLRSADIVLSNFKAGDAEKLGFDAPTLHRLNPRLLCGLITGFGPGERRSAFDIVLQAETGYMSMNGTPESGPLKMPVALIDILAAHQLKEGLLLALLQRMQTGQGATVQVSLYDAAIASLANQASNYLMAGQVAQRLGSLHPNIAPYGETFACADEKMIVLAVGSDKQFAALCRMLGCAGVASDQRFALNSDRVVNREAMSALLAPAFRKKNAADWMTLFIAGDVPAGLVRSIDEVLDQAAIRRLLLDETLGGMQTSRVKTTAFTILPASSGN